jgi:DNA-binding SARP family transcriptional activator
MEFRILGPLEVVDGGRTLPLGGPRQRALLALLLTRANRVVPRDELIDELWDDDAPDGARNALQYHVSRLRKALAPNDVSSRASRAT